MQLTEQEKWLLSVILTQSNDGAITIIEPEEEDVEAAYGLMNKYLIQLSDMRKYGKQYLDILLTEAGRIIANHLDKNIIGQ